MTLLIAYLVMSHVGVVSPWAYIGVFALWYTHLAWHMDTYHLDQIKKGNIFPWMR